MSNHHRLSTTTTASSSSSKSSSTTASKSSSSTSSTLTPSSPIDKFPHSLDTWDSDSDSDGWQDISIVHTDELRGVGRGGPEEVSLSGFRWWGVGGGGKGEGREGREGGEGGSRGGGNATGTTLDTDEYGYRWRFNPMQSKKQQQQHLFTMESNHTRASTALSTPFNPANSALIAARSNPAVLGRGDVMWPELVVEEVLVVLEKEEVEFEFEFEFEVGVEERESEPRMGVGEAIRERVEALVSVSGEVEEVEVDEEVEEGEGRTTRSPSKSGSWDRLSISFSPKKRKGGARAHLNPMKEQGTNPPNSTSFKLHRALHKIIHSPSQREVLTLRVASRRTMPEIGAEGSLAEEGDEDEETPTVFPTLRQLHQRIKDNSCAETEPDRLDSEEGVGLGVVD
ncbi:hypothetical protein GG344DRAFT_70221 [Lentinula edodes]|nr:hypothetical protein GG344DRAFT_70221 [Lentinula edodes]